MSFAEELTLLLDDLLNRRLSSVLIGCIAQIENHDTAKMTADVKPLIYFPDTGSPSEGQGQSGERQEYAVIPDVPVLFLNAAGYIIRPKYTRGDLVWVTFATHDINAPLKGSFADSGKKAFSLQNAAVICGIAGSEFTPPEGMDEDGLLLAHSAGGMMLLLTKDTIKAKCTSFDVEGDFSVSGKAAVGGALEAGEEITWNAKSLATKASTHTHNTGVGPSAPPTGGS